jgi:zinc transport system substrate-binding protein
MMHRGFFNACRVLAAAAICAWTGLSGAAAGDPAARTRVVATLFPLYDFARIIGHDRVQVSLLLPPGVEPHAFEPKPSDVAKVAQADVFITTGPAMEPWAEKIVKGLRHPKLLVVDASQGIALMKMEGGQDEAGHSPGRESRPGHDHGLRDVDPHIWLDLENAAMMVDTLTDALVRARPLDEALFRKNAEAYKAELRALDDAFAAGLSKCPKREFIHAGHYAFGYLARRYHLTYRAAQGFVPDSEPTARQLAILARQVRASGLKVVFFEELVEPRVARTVAREADAELLMLHGAHNLTRQDFDKGANFISIMQGNLVNRKRGLECPP